MRFKITVGQEFKIEDVEVVKAKTEYRAVRTRNLLSWAFVIIAVPFYWGAAFLGMADGTFNELVAVHIAAGPLGGALFVYHFGKISKE